MLRKAARSPVTPPAHDPVGLDEIHAHEADFRDRHPWVWLTTLCGPFVFSGIVLVTVLVFAGWEFTSRLVATTALALWLLGRFIILSGAEGGVSDISGPFSSFQLFLLVTYLDVMAALLLAFHIGFLFRVPFIGPRVAALVNDGHFILEAQPWMRQATFFGLIAFVGFPLAATGSVGGSIFGRLLGMSRVATFAGICIGSLIGNSLMYGFSDMMDQWIDKDHPAVQYGGLVVILAIVLLLERRYRSLRDRFASERRIEIAPPAPPAPHGPLASPRREVESVASPE